MNMQSPVVQGEVQVKMTPTSFNSHPPLVMAHLLQVDRSARGDNLIKCRSPIFQSPRKSNFDRTAVALPKEVPVFRFAHLWMIARRRNHAASGHDTYVAKMIGSWINDRAGVVWDQQ